MKKRRRGEKLAPAERYYLREQARILFWAGMSVTQIAQALGVSKTTVNFWRRAGRWDDEVRQDAEALARAYREGRQFQAKSR
jgi:uncharacterized protein YjcR